MLLERFERLRTELVFLVLPGLQQSRFYGTTRLELDVAVLGQLLVVYQIQTHAVIWMSVAGVYWNVMGAEFGILGVTLLKVFTAERCHLRSGQRQPGEKYGDRCTSRTTTSVCAGSAANTRTGWFKHPSSIASAAKWYWMGMSCFDGSHNIAPAEYIVA
jgi:hypothetical protein